MKSRRAKIIHRAPGQGPLEAMKVGRWRKSILHRGAKGETK